MCEIHSESLFPNTDFTGHSDSNHKNALIKYIVQTYISIRATQIARKISTDCVFKRSESRKKKEIEKELRKEKLTQKQKKLAHFEGR